MKIKIYKVENSDIIEHEDKRPGTILSVKKELLVKTLDGVIKIKLIQIPGKKMMAAKDFLNGQNVMYIDDIFNRGEEL
jgi:methionyl-tRNA formyltransferase